MSDDQSLSCDCGICRFCNGMDVPNMNEVTPEITAFSEAEARRLVKQWRAKAENLNRRIQQDDLSDLLAVLQMQAMVSTLDVSADQLEAILPKVASAE